MQDLMSNIKPRISSLSAVTGYQHLKDRMFLDQDFTEKNIFNLTQKQKLNTISEEIVLKSKPNRKVGMDNRHLWILSDIEYRRAGYLQRRRGKNY